MIYYNKSYKYKPLISINTVRKKEIQNSSIGKQEIFGWSLQHNTLLFVTTVKLRDFVHCVSKNISNRFPSSISGFNQLAVKITCFFFY